MSGRTRIDVLRWVDIISSSRFSFLSLKDSFSENICSRLPELSRDHLQVRVFLFYDVFKDSFSENRSSRVQEKWSPIPGSLFYDLSKGSFSENISSKVEYRLSPASGSLFYDFFKDSLPANRSSKVEYRLSPAPGSLFSTLSTKLLFIF